jgi:hypothetical protein
MEQPIQKIRPVNPEDYPNQAVAYETLNFGWVLSRPDIEGHRHIMVQF